MGVLVVGRKTWCGDNARGDPWVYHRRVSIIFCIVALEPGWSWLEANLESRQTNITKR
jgi:hypothetical protein